MVRTAGGAEGGLGVAAAQVTDDAVLQAAEVGGAQAEEKDGAVEDDGGPEHGTKEERPHDDAAAQKDVVERKVFHGWGVESACSAAGHQEVIATVSQIGVATVSQSH